jgi:hypothetical protein
MSRALSGHLGDSSQLIMKCCHFGLTRLRVVESMYCQMYCLPQLNSNSMSGQMRKALTQLNSTQLVATLLHLLSLTHIYNHITYIVLYSVLTICLRCHSLNYTSITI